MRTRIDSFLAERVFLSCVIDDDIPYVKNKGSERSPHHRHGLSPSDALRQDQIGTTSSQVAGQTWRQRWHRSYSFVTARSLPRCCFRSTASGMFHARFSTVMARTFAVLISWMLVLLSGLPIAALAQNAPATVTIDASLNRRPINPNIYGVAYGTAAQLTDLNAPLNRYGGNNTSRYNWQLNADNRGQDWYFESIGDTSAVAGERGDTFISNAQGGGAASHAHHSDDRLGGQARPEPRQARQLFASPSTARRPATTGSGFPTPATAFCIHRPADHRQRSQRRQRAGRPRRSSKAGCSTWSARWGTAANGGLRYYILDNEHSIWHSTHRDVHPDRRDHGRDQRQDHRLRRRRSRPSIPARWSSDRKSGAGAAIFYSGYDQQYGSLHGWSIMPDRNTHGGMDYLPWLLDQLQQNDRRHRPTPARRLHRALLSAGRRVRQRHFQRHAAAAQPLDALAVGSQLRRPNLDQRQGAADPAPARLGRTLTIPARPSASPNTTGARKATSTAPPRRPTSSASSAAKVWIWRRAGPRPTVDTPTYKAIKMYRNYDGNKSTFGDTSVCRDRGRIPTTSPPSPPSAPPTAR